MGCSASKSSEVVAPMPTQLKANSNLNSSQEDEKTGQPKNIDTQTNTRTRVLKKERSDDSLHGSQCSLNSNSVSAKSDRESSARSTRSTTDSGLGEFEEDPNIISERSTTEKQKIVLVEERPPTPELSIEGTKIARRKTLKEKRVSFSEKQEEVRNRINALAPMGGVTERPQSRGGMAFDIMLCPETGNVKRRPQHLRKLEKRKKKSTRRTKEEIDEKLKHADERRKEKEQQLREKAQAMITRENNKRALENFARSQMINEQTISS
ncbi:nucleolar protein 58-like [Montipora foliosa]|uniref:nucleolar protein 58-like n=1 Tax=Montipora foliosa TaxID=591990 RepID=UPI0035F18A62